MGYYYGGKPQPDGGGLSSEVGEDHQRVGDAVISLSSEVMFSEPHAVESRLLNGLSLFGKLGQDLVIGKFKSGVVKNGKKAELQGHTPLFIGLLEYQA